MKSEPLDIRSVFAEAIEKTDARERAAYLDRVCGKDTSLRSEVDSLLSSYGRAEGFLPSPDLDQAVTLDTATVVEGPGTIIGRYKLLEKIGEGGMAVVYMAEQTEPIHRKVAVKLIKLGMDTRQIIARFEVERQALALLDHPNIARVFDAGATETGRPYFVMELVRGVTVTDYCDQNRLDMRQRLQVFTQICNAVQHAHQKGIIHRDLKPSNVMVTMHDDKPVPKVIDFGIAKATSQRLTEKTLFTRYTQMIGTPAYMSPEQAQMSGLDIDTRTDIYSLGVLLYELLTGTTPFAPDTLQQAGYAEIERIIRETDPPKPSTRLRDMGQDLMEIAKGRQTSGEALRKLLRGDLDCLVMKCLEKDRTRRYATAHALAEDIERHLKDEPIQARSPGTIYRLQKFLRRHRSRIVVAAVVTLLLVGMAVTARMYRRASNLHWARGKALPQVVGLIKEGNYRAAFALAQKIEKYIPQDPALGELWPQICVEYSITTIPAGAEIFARELLDQEGSWQHVGCSPVRNARLPRGVYRWRIEKLGHEPRECVAAESFEVALQKKGDHPDMVLVHSPTYGDYLMDRYEVTNEQFQRFVEAGGYHKREYWVGLAFEKEGRELTWDQAMSEFCDKTGRPSPSTWESGSFPQGQESYPVGGISWYEAAAYAKFAGKSLPTISHWFDAAHTPEISLVIPYSNFGQGPAPVGSYAGIGRQGLSDMAGNVREWCWNSTDDSGTQHYILGGSWADPTYIFAEGDQRSAWDRSGLNGVRCAQYLQEGGQPAAALLSPRASCSPRNLSRLAPLTEEELPGLLAYYAYDRTPLNDTVQEKDDTSPLWRKEKVTFDATHGGARMTAYLFLPKAGRAPYQVVVFFPGAAALFNREFGQLAHREATEFVIASGRALLYPVYEGTYDRPHIPGGDWSLESFRRTPMMYRDWIVQMAKDLGRSVDYLETRSDIDRQKIAYYGFCWGASLGFIMIPTQERFQTAILVAGGLPPVDRDLPRFIDPAVLAQAIRIPVLMLNGTEDPRFPLKTSQVPAYQLLGTPREHKQHKLYPGGHELYGLFPEQVHADVLGWLDRYLGPVGQK